MIRAYLPRDLEDLTRWYMRYISPAALVAGFLLDNLVLLRRVDLWMGHVLLFTYLFVAAACIVLLNLITSGRIKNAWIMRATPIIPVAAQFAFGGLFSAYLALYSRSAAYSVSWIFVIIVAGLLLGNERFVRLYMRFSFQIAIFFTSLFSFLIFFLPVVLLRIDTYIFLLSGVVSLALIALLVGLLYSLTPEIVLAEGKRVARSIAIIYVLFNVLYFTNAIPPLPLALKDAGIYHGISKKSEGGYTVLEELVPWYEAYLRYNTSFHLQQGSTAYAFSAIFAPSGLSTVILHEWQRYDDVLGAWVTTDTLRFPITGGRDGGYRGYTIKTVTPGKWRVNVITQSGRLIGRLSFAARSDAATRKLEELEK